MSPEELQEKEVQLHFLKNFVALSSDIFCNLDKSGYCLYINKGFEKITGHKENSVIGTHFKKYIHLEDSEKFFSLIQLKLKKGETETILSRLINKKGDEFFVEWKVKGDENNSIFLAGRNVTEKISTEKEIIEKNNLFSSISRSLPVVIYIQNIQDQKLEFVSEYIKTVSGYSPDELYSKSPDQLYSILQEDDLKIVTESIKNFYNNRDAISNENNFRLRHKNGEFKRVSSKETVYKTNRKGRTTHILGSLIDVTEQYNAELYKDEIERLQNEKTQKIRSLSILQGQEEERKRLARDLHDGIGQLLTAIRIKLNDIEGNFLKDLRFKKSIEEVIEIVLKTIQETRNISSALVPVDLYDFGLDPSLKYLCETAARGSSISIVYNSNLENARLNPIIEIELFRIVQEALNNSLKHSRAKSIDVTLSFSEKKGAVKVLIIDNGVGFDFGSEYIYKEGKKRSYGLRNMHERASIINGKIAIISRKAQGCVISIEVPLKLNEL